MKRLDFKISEAYKSISDDRGHLSAFNEIEDFTAKRLFFITCKKGNWRGKHYHKLTTQIIFVVAGEIDVRVTNASGTVQNGKMQQGAYYRQEPYTQFEFLAASEEAQLIVLCNTAHDPQDYYVNAS